jgi:hypothetical protein
MRTNDPFGSSYVALLADLWFELETVLRQHYASDAAPRDRQADVELRLQALLLELDLISDKIDTLNCRGTVAPAHAGRIQALIVDLRNTLATGVEQIESRRLGVTIVLAQNRVFDEVQRVANVDAAVEITPDGAMLIQLDTPNAQPSRHLVARMGL